MNLREARFYAGLSQNDIALKTGIPQSRISLIENKYCKPNADERKKIATMLNKTATELFPIKKGK
jgi:transcriptional regulator with XRE-family HTH domain|tara:strand:+ start:319 stop:513 length:195 start_codon:yes stop_codon:yes gene_type:complete